MMSRWILLLVGVGAIAVSGCAQVPAQRSAEYGAVAFNAGTRDYGVSWGKSSPDAARREALGTCGPDCALLENFGPRECATLASRPNSPPQVAIGATKDRAKQRALQSCGAGCTVVPPECNR
ncbi:MAG: DUF4189 domain-containing protein [Rhodospirillum sp.]|nr:DUF4189 domain-containing protein [Rhodospirillum sp.]MCF8487590.1 DUF4189 domain-containing protein [Rhodospirillum sp.]MCF8500245.1 DUF4189 domain-containing protein [Rhodospirillum sp.]